MRRVAVLVLPDVHLLDLAGPVQTFYEANECGANYQISHCGVLPEVRSAQGLLLSHLEPLPSLGRGDTVLIPGMDSSTIDRLSHAPLVWLRDRKSVV